MNSAGKTIELAELKQIELGILDAFDAFCREHGLLYSLAGGTLLGAVRHKGFIPWDDDIDVMMPRDDYEKLISLRTGFPDSYEIRTEHTYESPGKPFLYTYMKIVDTRTKMVEIPQTLGYETCVYIDVFPIDGQPSQTVDITRRYRKARKLINKGYFLQALPYYREKHTYSGAKSVVAFCIDIVRKIMGKNVFYTRLHKMAIECAVGTAENVGCIVAGYGTKEIMPKDAFFPIGEIEFEGRRFMSIHAPHVYLSNLYDDYMTLPPVDKQKVTHDNVAYWRD